jgi:hypothetical protein
LWSEKSASNGGQIPQREQVNINFHSEKRFQSIVKQGLVNGGIHLNALKNHGKSRLLFLMARHLRNLADCRVYIFDGSDAWLYGFDAIPTFMVKERDIVLAKDIETIEQIERYNLKNWQLVRLALKLHKALLFRLKTRKPSKRGFFTRTVINYLDASQRAQRATTEDNEATQYIAYFIEEAQNCFNSRSTTRLEAEEFLTVFNEARNQKEAFFTASQRLTDFSKTIRTKQTYCLGKINDEDKTPFLRRLEKKHEVNFSEFPQRQWFFEGLTFKSPEWKQKGKPYQINKEIKQRYIESLSSQTETQKPSGTVFYAMPKRKPSALDKLKAIFKALFTVDRADLDKPHLWKNKPKKHKETLNQEIEREEQEDDETLGTLGEPDEEW